MNLDKISESKVVNVLTRIGIMVCVYCFLYQIYGLENDSIDVVTYANPSAYEANWKK